MSLDALETIVVMWFLCSLVFFGLSVGQLVVHYRKTSSTKTWMDRR